MAEVKGAESALRLLNEIDRTLTSTYQPYWAVRARAEEDALLP